jgi:hypothetical protein
MPNFFTSYTFDIHEGLPPEGEPGFFVGFADDWTPYLLKWSVEREFLCAAGFQDFENVDGFMLRAINCRAMTGEEIRKVVKRYAALPAVLSALAEDIKDG